MHRLLALQCIKLSIALVATLLKAKSELHENCLNVSCSVPTDPHSGLPGQFSFMWARLALFLVWKICWQAPVERLWPSLSCKFEDVNLDGINPDVWFHSKVFPPWWKVLAATSTISHKVVNVSNGCSISQHHACWLHPKLTAIFLKFTIKPLERNIWKRLALCKRILARNVRLHQFSLSCSAARKTRLDCQYPNLT